MQLSSLEELKEKTENRDGKTFGAFFGAAVKKVFAVLLRSFHRSFVCITFTTHMRNIVPGPD